MQAIVDPDAYGERSTRREPAEPAWATQLPQPQSSCARIRHLQDAWSAAITNIRPWNNASPAGFAADPAANARERVIRASASLFKEEVPRLLESALRDAGNGEPRCVAFSFIVTG